MIQHQTTDGPSVLALIPKEEKQHGKGKKVFEINLEKYRPAIFAGRNRNSLNFIVFCS